MQTEMCVISGVFGHSGSKSGRWMFHRDQTETQSTTLELELRKVLHKSLMNLKCRTLSRRWAH